MLPLWWTSTGSKSTPLVHARRPRYQRHRLRCEPSRQRATRSRSCSAGTVRVVPVSLHPGGGCRGARAKVWVDRQTLVTGSPGGPASGPKESQPKGVNERSAVGQTTCASTPAAEALRVATLDPRPSVGRGVLTARLQGDRALGWAVPTIRWRASSLTLTAALEPHRAQVPWPPPVGWLRRPPHNPHPWSSCVHCTGHASRSQRVTLGAPRVLHSRSVHRSLATRRGVVRSAATVRISCRAHRRRPSTERRPQCTS